MPIVSMKKVFLLGHQKERSEILSLLQKAGSIELLDVKSGISWDEIAEAVTPDSPDKKVSDLESRLGEIKYCIDFLQRYFPARKSFVQQFTGGKIDLSAEQYGEYAASMEKAKEFYSQCRQIEEELSKIRNEETQSQNSIEELIPWESLDLPLEEIGEGNAALIGLYQVTDDRFTSLVEKLNKTNGYCHSVSVHDDVAHFVFAGLVKEQHLYSEIFKEESAVSVKLFSYFGTAKENIDRLQQNISKLSNDRQELIKKIESLVEQRPFLMAVFDYLNNEYEKHMTVSNFARTNSSFILEGWIPEPVLPELEEALSTQTETALLVSRDPQAGEIPPVLLENKKPANAYEVVTKLYSTPKRNELDPTPFLAPFFFIFFGICLSDAGYGLVLALLAVFITRKLKLENMGKQLMNLLLMGGISALLFGFLLGSVFGDLLNLKPLWFNPLEDPMRMLVYCFAIGLFHIYFGMALQAYRNIKSGQLWSAIYDQGFWFLFLNGLILLILPETSIVGKWLAIGGAIGLIATQGRSQQGIVKKFFSGLLSLYNITGYLSDVLSYSRLLALGLATGVIASAINAMVDMLPGGVVGSIVMVLILLGGHLFNIIISSLGAYVHTSRLQYIEFFVKFFEGGGRSYKPFQVKNSYINITKADEV